MKQHQNEWNYSLMTGGSATKQESRRSQVLTQAQSRLNTKGRCIWRDSKVHMRQKSLAASVGQVGPRSRSGCVADTHTHTHAMWKMCAVSHTRRFRAFQFTTASHWTSCESVHSCALQRHTSDQLCDTINHTHIFLTPSVRLPQSPAFRSQ